MAYDAYGQTRSGSNSTPFGHGGRYGYYRDSETGLECLAHRYYEPATGRFLTQDPIGMAGGMNLYGYVGGNPVGGADNRHPAAPPGGRGEHRRRVPPSPRPPISSAPGPSVSSGPSV